MYFGDNTKPKMAILVSSDDAICAVQILTFNLNFLKYNQASLKRSEVPLIHLSIYMTTWTDSYVLDLVSAILQETLYINVLISKAFLA